VDLDNVTGLRRVFAGVLPRLHYAYTSKSEVCEQPLSQYIVVDVKQKFSKYTTHNHRNQTRFDRLLFAAIAFHHFQVVSPGHDSIFRPQRLLFFKWCVCFAHRIYTPVVYLPTYYRQQRRRLDRPPVAALYKYYQLLKDKHQGG